MVSTQALCPPYDSNDLVSRTRHGVPSPVHGRAWTRNRENNPMQSRVDPQFATLLRPSNPTGNFRMTGICKLPVVQKKTQGRRGAHPQFPARGAAGARYPEAQLAHMDSEKRKQA
jgi:hypothetical protein